MTMRTEDRIRKTFVTELLRDGCSWVRNEGHTVVFNMPQGYRFQVERTLRYYRQGVDYILDGNILKVL